MLEHTAHSVNIKERLDFSCALFAPDGSLIANAPHIPVHLGSMGDSVQSILRSKQLAPGDAYLLNTPYNGGTHLPDLTVVTPVFDARGRRLRYFVASRAHHADIGGSTPGSMPPTSRSIDEEGVLLDGVQIVAGGELLETEVRAAARARPISGAQSRPEHRRSQSTARRQRARRRRARAAHRSASAFVPSSATCGTCSTTPRPACAPRSRGCATGASRSSSTAASGSASPSASTRRGGARPSTSRARRPRAPATSTRRRRSCARPCCTCSGRWSARAFRSTPAASSR